MCEVPPNHGLRHLVKQHKRLDGDISITEFMVGRSAGARCFRPSPDLVERRCPCSFDVLHFPSDRLQSASKVVGGIGAVQAVIQLLVAPRRAPLLFLRYVSHGYPPRLTQRRLRPAIIPPAAVIGFLCGAVRRESLLRSARAMPPSGFYRILYRTGRNRSVRPARFSMTNREPPDQAVRDGLSNTSRHPFNESSSPLSRTQGPRSGGGHFAFRAPCCCRTARVGQLMVS